MDSYELTERHIAYLKHVKKTRLSYITSHNGPLLIVPVAILYFSIRYLISISKEPEFYLNEIQLVIGLIIFTLIFMFIIPLCITYFKRMLPINKDIMEGKGIITANNIIGKQHYPFSNEYFFFFAEHDMPNIKIDATTFSHYQKGDIFTLKKAKYSNVIFEDYERYYIV